MISSYVPMLLLQSLMQGICVKIETVPRANSEAQSNPVRLAYMR